MITYCTCSGRDAGALQGRLDRDAAELGRREVLEVAQQAPHGGTRAADDHRSHVSGLRGGCRPVRLNDCSARLAPWPRFTPPSSPVRTMSQTSGFSASTTSGSPSPTWTPRSTSTSASSGCAACTPRPTPSRAYARRCSRSGRPPAGGCVQLLAPLTPGVDDREVPRPQRAGRAAGRVHGGRHRRRPARRCASAAMRLLYDAPRRGTAELPDQLRPPQGRRRRPGRAGRARRRPLTDRPLPPAGEAPGGRPAPPSPPPHLSVSWQPIRGAVPTRIGTPVPLHRLDARADRAGVPLARRRTPHRGARFDSVSVSDHLTGGWSMDPVVAMTVAAEATSRLRVLALVFCNDWRWRPPGAGARRPARGHRRDQPPPRRRREFRRRAPGSPGADGRRAQPPRSTARLGRGRPTAAPRIASMQFFSSDTSRYLATVQ